MSDQVPDYKNVVVVEMYRCAPGRRGSRGQRWRWRATNKGNGKVMATSGEAYTNEQDCAAAVTEVFGDETRVWRKHPTEPDVILREAVNL